MVIRPISEQRFALNFVIHGQNRTFPEWARFDCETIFNPDSIRSAKIKTIKARPMPLATY